MEPTTPINADPDALRQRIDELDAELAASRTELRAVTRRLVQVQEDERRALARDLHDTSGEAMTILGLGLSVVQREAGCSEKTSARLAQLRNMAASVGEDLHRLAVNLRPSSLDRYGLVPALEELIRTWQLHTGINLEFRAEGLDERLPGDLETALYRVVQEACTNIARYAEARTAKVHLSRTDGTVGVYVCDDGQGFDVAVALAKGRLGLVGMRERAEMFGGTFRIESAAGQGTEIWVNIPVDLSGLQTPRQQGLDRSGPGDLSGFGSLPQGGADRSGDGAIPPEPRALAEAAELARAKALSDALVDLMAGTVGRTSREGLLDFVLEAATRAIGCDFAFVAVHDGGEWCILRGHRIPEEVIGRRLPGEQLPLTARAEQTRSCVMATHIQQDPTFHGLPKDWGAEAGAAIPLLAGGGFFGTAVFFHTTLDAAFRQSEMDFLDRLGTLVSLLLENVQLRDAEAKLTAAEAKNEAIYRAIARSFPGAAIYVFDHDLRFQVVDGEALAIFHQTSTGMEGKTIWEALDAETAAVIEPRYRRTLAGESLHFETRYGPQYGNRIVAADYRPIRDADGRVTAGLLVARDLSERSHLLAQLQGHIAELDGILAALPSGLIVYNAHGGVIRINAIARQMLGYDEATWQRPVSEHVTRAVQLTRPDGAPLAWHEYPAIRALAGEDVKSESFFMHLPGRPDLDCWAVLSATPLRGPKGERLGAAVTLTDVTELHEAQARLQAANYELQTQAGALREAKERLEQRVQERTGELAAALEQMEGHRSQLKALSRRLVDMQENERSYVADQLYNQAAQVLAAVRMQLWLLEKHQAEDAGGSAGDDGGGAMEGIKDALDQTILALHDLATQLRPAGLTRVTLARVLRDFLARYLAGHAIAFDFDAGNAEDVRVPNEVVTAVFRTIQEAASNIVRHSAAGRVRLTLNRQDGELTIALADDGVGFDPGAQPASGGVGLVAMRERIESVGGRLTVASAGRGTTVRLAVPVGAEA